MAYICFNCGKGTIHGTQHRHKPGVAGRQHLRRAPHTPKDFIPNLHSALIIENGRTQKVLLCTKCRRLLKKLGKIKVWSKEHEIIKAKEEKVVKEVKKVEKKVPTILSGSRPEGVGKKPAKKPKKVKLEAKPAAPTISVEDLVGKKK